MFIVEVQKKPASVCSGNTRIAFKIKSLNVVDDNEKRKQRVLPASFCHGCLLE
jgi:hypothetical protein